MTKLPFNRPVAAFVLLTFCVSVGCTAYRDDRGGYDWEPIPLSELPGSEYKFRGKRMAFRLAPEGRIDVVVERIDSTFVYARNKTYDDYTDRVEKIRLDTIRVVEIHHNKSSHAGWIVPVTLIVLVVGMLVITYIIVDRAVDEALP